MTITLTEVIQLQGLPTSVRRATARLLLVALSLTTAGPILHGVHEEDCEPAFVFHDESDHHLQAAGGDADSSSATDHCVACHFARSSRGAAAWELTGLVALTPGALLTYDDRQLVIDRASLPLPARAPPRS